MSSQKYILVVNCGSSSLKFALYNLDDRHCVGKGSIVGIGVDAKPTPSTRGELLDTPEHVGIALDGQCTNTTEATDQLLKYLGKIVSLDSIVAVGHRVVHGGDLSEHCLLDPAKVLYLKSLYPLDPLHQPYNVEPIELIAERYPQIPQVACCDTIYHASIPKSNRIFGIPRQWYDKGVKRYGFHGLSYEYIETRLEKLSPKALKGNTIIAHLGSGASMSAMKNGKAYDTTMSFSTLDGLVMSTRPGFMDPGVILYLVQVAKFNEKQLEKFLCKECGLVGVSGISPDMEALLNSPAPEAKEAVDLFCHRLRCLMGSLTSTMGGLDTIVFTGGIGENSIPIRARAISDLKWLGAEIDDAKNAAATGDKEMLISSANSKIEVWRIPTNEEGIIVDHTCKLALGL